MDTVRKSQHDRQYLEGLIDRYFVALVAHDSGKLPLAKNMKATENTVAVALNDGLWATASDLPTYINVFCDIVEGQAGCFAVLKERGNSILMSLRLKEQDKVISEIETLVFRPRRGDLRAFESLSRPNPVFAEELAPAERSPRKKMIAIADAYFDGIQNHTGDYVQFDDDCHRSENGMITANNPNPGPESNPMSAMTAMKCIDQFKLNTFYFITKIQPRRYLVIDEERGLVLCNAMFVHAGNILEAEIPGRGKVKTPAFALRPSNVLVSELFKIKNGKIREIEVVGTMFPYGIKSGWD